MIHVTPELDYHLVLYHIFSSSSRPLLLRYHYMYKAILTTRYSPLVKKVSLIAMVEMVKVRRFRHIVENG